MSRPRSGFIPAVLLACVVQLVGLGCGEDDRSVNPGGITGGANPARNFRDEPRDDGEGGGGGWNLYRSCLIAPQNLDFGDVVVGSSNNLTFRITNNGTTVVTGDVSEGCGDYSIMSGAGPFSLSAGQSLTVSVRFSPSTLGQQLCSVETGTQWCSGVSCVGVGVGVSECIVDPTYLDFRDVGVGLSKDLTFRITNNGTGVVTGDVSEACGDYSVVSGAGPFSLSAGQSLTVSVRFSPSNLGQQVCSVETGASLCSDVSCTGVGFEPPSYLEAPAIPDYNATSLGFTLECWVKVRGLPGPDPRIVRCIGPTEGPCGNPSVEVWQLFLDGSTGKVYFSLEDAGNCYELLSTESVTNGAFHHIAATYDGAVMKIYIDGELSNSRTVAGIDVDVTGGKLVVGNATAYNNAFDGQIDEFRIWNIVRTAAEIQDGMHTELGPAPHLVGYWRFNGDATDLGGDNDLTAHGTVTYVAGYLNQAVDVSN